MVKEIKKFKKLNTGENSIFTCAFDKENISALKNKIFFI